MTPVQRCWGLDVLSIFRYEFFSVFYFFALSTFRAFALFILFNESSKIKATSRTFIYQTTYSDIL